MQKCLQRTRKIKTVCTLLCTGSFLVSALILTKAPDIAVDNTALYYKRSGKYLDKTSEYTLQTFTEKKEIQNEQTEKMNNLSVENAKNVQKNEIKNGTIIYSKFSFITANTLYVVILVFAVLL